MVPVKNVKKDAKNVIIIHQIHAYLVSKINSTMNLNVYQIAQKDS